MANYNSGGNTSAPPPVKACNYCHNSHVACDGGRPCGRCVKRGVADHCCDLVPRKKGRPARNDPRFRPKYPNSCTTSTAGNTTNHSKIDNTSPRPLGCSTTLGTGASDMGTSTSQAPSRPLEASGPWSRPERHHMHHQHTDGLPCSDGDYDDEDEDDDEDEEQEQERWRKQSRDERSREAEPPPELASRMIAMMADELHQLRKENAKLRRKVKKLRNEKRARKEDADHSHSHSNHNRGRSAGSANPKRPRYDDSPTATLQSQPQPVETWPSAVAAGECSGLIEARKHMPFLNHYRMSADTPFVVSDLHSYWLPDPTDLI